MSDHKCSCAHDGCEGCVGEASADCRADVGSQNDGFTHTTIYPSDLQIVYGCGEPPIQGKMIAAAIMAAACDYKSSSCVVDDMLSNYRTIMTNLTNG